MAYTTPSMTSTRYLGSVSSFLVLVKVSLRAAETGMAPPFVSMLLSIKFNCQAFLFSLLRVLLEAVPKFAILEQPPLTYFAIIS
jgi:hypothetical protein